MSYYDNALKWWTGTAWYPMPADWSDIDFKKEAASSVSTSITLAVSATTINNGQSVTLTATVSGASTGSVQFRTGSATGPVIATDAASPWTTAVSPTASTTYYATYVANGVYLGSASAGKTVTVKQKSNKVASYVARNSWQWGQSSAPNTVHSTFGVNSGTNNIPYASAVITGIRIQLAGYYGSSAGNASVVTAGVYNSSGGALATVSVTLAKAAGSDTPLSATMNIADITVTTGTYRIGFTKSASYATQWDEQTAATGYTGYHDGSGIANQSLLWEIDYYVWV